MEVYADAIEALSIVDGDPEVYFRDFEKSLSSPQNKLETNSIQSASSTNSKCQIFNPGFFEFIADAFRGLLCLIVFPCCTLNDCLERGPQTDQPPKRAAKSN